MNESPENAKSGIQSTLAKARTTAVFVESQDGTMNIAQQ